MSIKNKIWLFALILAILAFPTDAFACRIYLDRFHFHQNTDTLTFPYCDYYADEDSINNRLYRYLTFLGNEVDTTSAFFALDSFNYDVIFLFTAGIPTTAPDIVKIQEFCYEGGFLVVNGEIAVHGDCSSRFRSHLEHFLNFPDWNLSIRLRWDEIFDPLHYEDLGSVNFYYNFSKINPITKNIDTLLSNVSSSIEYSFPSIPLAFACSSAYSLDADSFELYDVRDTIVPSAPAVIACQGYGIGLLLLVSDKNLWTPDFIHFTVWPWDTFDVKTLIENVFGYCQWRPFFIESPRESTKLICPEGNVFTLTVSNYGVLDTSSIWCQVNGSFYYPPCEEIGFPNDTTIRFSLNLYEVSGYFDICFRGLRDTSGIWSNDSMCFTYLTDYEDTTPPRIDSLIPNPFYLVDTMDTVIFSFDEPETELDTTSIWISIDDTVFFTYGDSRLKWIDSLHLQLVSHFYPPPCTVTTVFRLHFHVKLRNLPQFCLPETLDTMFVFTFVGSEIFENTTKQPNLSLTIPQNPVGNNVNIFYSLGSNSFGKLQIFDIAGKLIKVVSLSGNKSGTLGLNFSAVPQGVYLVVLSSGNNRILCKTIKL
jgi:hypothetical protein